MEIIIKNQNDDTDDIIDWDDPSWDEEEYEYVPPVEETKYDEWHTFSHVDIMQTLCEGRKEVNTDLGIDPFLQARNNLTKKEAKAASKNTQKSVKIPAITLGGAFDQQIELIRNMARNRQYNQLYNMGANFLKELEDKFEYGYEQRKYSLEDIQLINKNCRLAMICCKISAEHGNLHALWKLGESFLFGVGLPHNPHLAYAIFSKLAPFKRAHDPEQAKRYLEGALNCLKFEIEEEYPPFWSKKTLSYAEYLEQKHYPEEEWILYEYYYTSTYKLDQNQPIKPKRKYKDKYYDERVDWDWLLTLPWMKNSDNDNTPKKQTSGKFVQAIKMLFSPGSGKQEDVARHSGPVIVKPHSKLTERGYSFLAAASSKTPETPKDSEESKQLEDDELWYLAHEEEERLHEEYLAEMDYWYNGPGNEYYSEVTGQVEEPGYFEDHPDEYRG